MLPSGTIPAASQWIPSAKAPSISKINIPTTVRTTMVMILAGESRRSALVTARRSIKPICLPRRRKKNITVTINPTPPTWIRNRITTWPMNVNVFTVVTIFKPVTVAAEVDVKSAVKKLIGWYVIPGSKSNPVPVRIRMKSPVTNWREIGNLFGEGRILAPTSLITRRALKGFSPMVIDILTNAKCNQVLLLSNHDQDIIFIQNEFILRGKDKVALTDDQENCDIEFGRILYRFFEHPDWVLDLD